MLFVAVGSKNKSKLKGVFKAFHACFPGEKIRLLFQSVDSGVPRQPLSSEQTRQGCQNRAKQLLTVYPQADYYVGIESGLKASQRKPGFFVTKDWAYVIDKFGDGIDGCSGGMYLPYEMCLKMARGETLKQSMQDVHVGREDVVAHLTGDNLNRVDETRIVVAQALSPFLKKENYHGLFDKCRSHE